MRILSLLTALFLPGLAAGEAPALQPLAPAERAILWGSPEDVLDKKPCVGTRLAATLTCRDAHSHVTTNEWYHNVFVPYIRDLGGGYVGIGSDQGLSFIAHARSSVGWLIDYDPTVLLVNLIHRGLILRSGSSKEFLARWSDDGAGAAAAALAEVYAAHPERGSVVRAFRSYRKTLEDHFRVVMNIGRTRSYHWLHDPGRYRFVREMFQRDRIRIMPGDLLKDRSLQGIADACRKLKVSVRILYLSNAEDYWKYTPQFKRNMVTLPFDDRTVLLRTKTTHDGPTIGKYQYVIQRGLSFQRLLRERGTSGVWTMMRHGTSVEPGLITIGLSDERATKK